MDKSEAPLNKVKMLIASSSDTEGHVHYETFSRPAGVIIFNKDAKKTCKFRVTDSGQITDMMYYNHKEEWQRGKP